ncbi:MAG TPA: hypothetical protein VJN70_07060, partial [Gemmatimonadaceae bacterium]|nr:hypothetical protein [Gemmatimonadaceae bacterium]
MQSVLHDPRSTTDDPRPTIHDPRPTIHDPRPTLPLGQLARPEWAMTVGQLVAAIAIAAAIGAGSTSCSRFGSSAKAGTDTVFIGVAATRTSVAYFRGAQLALDKLNAERARESAPLGLRMPPAVQTTQVAVAARFRDDPAV